MLQCTLRGQTPYFRESLATIRGETGRRKTKAVSSIALLHLYRKMKGDPVGDKDLNRWRLILCGASRSVVKKCSVSMQKTPVFIVGNPMLDIWRGIVL